MPRLTLPQLERHLFAAAEVLRSSTEASAYKEYIWQLLGRVMPDYDEREQELAKRGASLWFRGVS